MKSKPEMQEFKLFFGHCVSNDVCEFLKDFLLILSVARSWQPQLSAPIFNTWCEHHKLADLDFQREIGLIHCSWTSKSIPRVNNRLPEVGQKGFLIKEAVLFHMRSVCYLVCRSAGICQLKKTCQLALTSHQSPTTWKPNLTYITSYQGTWVARNGFSDYLRFWQNKSMDCLWSRNLRIHKSFPITPIQTAIPTHSLHHKRRHQPWN